MVHNCLVHNCLGVAVEAATGGALLVAVSGSVDNTCSSGPNRGGQVDSDGVAADMTIGSAHGLAVSVSWEQDVILTGHANGVVSVTNIVRV
jgi:hypothetical protein